MITLQNLRWASGRFTLEVDATLRGRVTGLFGPSGSGKTTLLELIAGLRRPGSGAIRIGDSVVCDTAARRHEPPELRHVGHVPQDGALFPHLNVEQNLRYGLARAGESGGAKDAFGFDAVCRLLELGGLLKARPSDISGGERQRVALGRALLSRPRALLLDEPLSGLDAARKEAIFPHLRAVRDELRVPMVFVSHDPDDVATLCDDVLVLRAGRIVAQAAPATLFEAIPGIRYRTRH